jgi:hypothetical protein
MTLRTFKTYASRRRQGLAVATMICLAPWQTASAQITVAGPMNFDLTTSHLQAVQMQSSLISTSRIMQQQNEYHRSALGSSWPLASAATRSGGYAAPVAALPSLTIAHDPRVSGELRNEVFSNIERATSADTARKVDQTLGDIQTTFSRAVSPYGLHNDDFADVMAAYLVVMWMAANERTALPNVAQVQAVRAQMQRLYSNGAQPPIEIRQRQLVAETLMYETCLAIGTRENGSAQAIRNMADSTQRKLARNGFDMRSLALTDAGLVQRTR